MKTDCVKNTFLEEIAETGSIAELCLMNDCELKEYLIVGKELPFIYALFIHAKIHLERELDCSDGGNIQFNAYVKNKKYTEIPDLYNNEYEYHTVFNCLESFFSLDLIKLTFNDPYLSAYLTRLQDDFDFGRESVKYRQVSEQRRYNLSRLTAQMELRDKHILNLNCARTKWHKCFPTDEVCRFYCYLIEKRKETLSSSIRNLAPGNEEEKIRSLLEDDDEIKMLKDLYDMACREYITDCEEEDYGQEGFSEPISDSTEMDEDSASQKRKLRNLRNELLKLTHPDVSNSANPAMAKLKEDIYRMITTISRDSPNFQNLLETAWIEHCIMETELDPFKTVSYEERFELLKISNEKLRRSLEQIKNECANIMSRVEQLESEVLDELVIYHTIDEEISNEESTGTNS